MHQRRWQNSCVILDSLREVVLSDHDYVESSHSDPPFTWGCPPKTSKVEKIRLENFECHLELLENLLGACQALTSFSWGPSRNATGNTQWQWSEAKALLETLQPGLQALELCERYDYSDTRLGTLEKFASLRYLAVPFELLISMQYPSLICNLLTHARSSRQAGRAKSRQASANGSGNTRTQQGLGLSRRARRRV